MESKNAADPVSAQVLPWWQAASHSDRDIGDAPFLPIAAQQPIHRAKLCDLPLRAGQWHHRDEELPRFRIVDLIRCKEDVTGIHHRLSLPAVIDRDVSHGGDFLPQDLFVVLRQIIEEDDPRAGKVKALDAGEGLLRMIPARTAADPDDCVLSLCDRKERRGRMIDACLFFSDDFLSPLLFMEEISQRADPVLRSLPADRVYVSECRHIIGIL